MTVVQLGQRERRARPSLLGRRVTPGMVVLVVGAIAVLRIWVVETAIVEGQSMESGLHTEDRVLVVKPLSPHRFDVVVLKEPDLGGTAIKRVVGLPGDTVSMVPRPLIERGREVVLGSQLYVNGQPYEEPYASSVLPESLTPRRVPPGSYFVMGDNRDVSTDSRRYGPVSRGRIQGVAVAVVYPFSQARILTRGQDAGARPATAASD